MSMQEVSLHDPLRFDIRETLSRKVMVKADSMEEAWDEVDRMYMESEIVLNADDFKEMEILWVE